MRPGALVAAAICVAALAARWHRLPLRLRIGLAVAAAALTAWGVGVVHLPNLETIARDIGASLGPYTYVVVGLLALLETGAGIGLVAPGELAVVIGGVTAGQGHTELLALIAIVWGCAVMGDVTSYALGRHLGRAFLLRHGRMLKLTPERLTRVEMFFARHGTKTIILGRFVGLVRAIAPFVAASSNMPARRFIPATFVAAGLWSAAFSTLGYVFWHSFDQAAAVAQQGTMALVGLIAIGVAATLGYRMLIARGRRSRLPGSANPGS